eukprot:GFUD01014514.1.p1 GENE.GFUD01014514.1~~GFUD01014514.1.p1  ORF type:complete len:280 (+),score=66.75 GFUD01014514.1:109-948(+)
MPVMLTMSFFLILILNNAHGAEQFNLKPEPVIEEVVPVFPGQDVTLACESEDPVRWWRAKDNGSYVEESDKYEIEDNNLEIKQIKSENFGTYHCLSETDVLASFKVERKFRLSRMAKSYTITEGSSTGDMIKCSFKQEDRELLFVWLSKPVSDEESARPVCVKSSEKLCPATREYNEHLDNLAKRVTITEGQDEDGQFSILSINDTVPEDRRIYICKAVDKTATDKEIKNCEESNECDEVETILRVKDKLVALWPALGILTEVILILIITCAFEKTKKE